MFSPLELKTALTREDLKRVHYHPPDRGRSYDQGLTLLRAATRQVQVFVVRLHQGVPVRVLRAIDPVELQHPKLLPGQTAYALAFRHDGQDTLLVVSPGTLAVPEPGTLRDLLVDAGMLPAPPIDRAALVATPRVQPPPAPAAQPQSQRKVRPKNAPQRPLPDGRAGKQVGNRGKKSKKKRR
ncbi:hypothetical protein [Deinococcus multiflagellatus]|uniref:Uncharacterized protein n=1 Tax=Deinococcus multiflagellatus TaxID=1656887 RepID=A0ABW1ZTS1_9DEIO|nr:hypothetical protein [Deinococcus multiflagellatus]MBZ9715326.1 hypothetical protein [Deinococcus multiflagellatus]